MLSSVTFNNEKRPINVHLSDVQITETMIEILNSRDPNMDLNFNAPEKLCPPNT